MFDGYIRDQARWTPRARAVVTPARAISYAELDAHVDSLGHGLRAMGLGPGSGVVAVALDDPYLQLATMAALARLGAPSSPAHDPAADHRLDDDAALAGLLATPADPLPALWLDPDATGRVMLSSGTTRTPRRVALSWRRIEIANAATLRTYACGKTGTFVPLTGEGSLLGFCACVAAWSVGGTVAVGLPVGDLPGWLEALPPGFVGLTPRQLRDLLAALPAGFRPLPDWRLGVAGAPLPVPLAREALARLTPDVRIVYGATECSLIGYGHARDLETVPGQVGLTPAGALLEVVDDDGRPLPDGQPGEFRIRTERMTVGYLDDPEATAERFHGGWFLTRDVGHRRPDGLLVIEGRADDRLNLEGGGKFMPGVLEAAAYAADPCVLDCAAFAAPDRHSAEGFEQCWLAVVAAPDLDRDAFVRRVAAEPGLPPLRLAWMDEIPRNAMGKIERNRLRDILTIALAQG